ncbi:MAG: hypothetical protein ACFFG0_50205 [Candidatus Thorarchaeota archaeon]
MVDPLVDFIAISDILAGSCVTFIALILNESIMDCKICTTNLTFGQIAVLIFGFSTAFFISAAELFLRTKELNIYGMRKERLEFLKSKFDNWNDVEIDNDDKCENFEFYASKCYNLSIFLIFVGLLFVIYLYNWLFVFTVSGLGIFLEFI